jgi:NAD-dependent deacetylase
MAQDARVDTREEPLNGLDGPLAVLTGAGVSAESGVPTFRGAGGLWHNYRAVDLATPQAFHRDPKLVWEFYAWRRQVVAHCQPNPAHQTLAEMERRLPDVTLITQNVDGLHQRAGSQRVITLHGDLWRVRCTRCDYHGEDHRVPLPELPPRCPLCNHLLRPDVVWFGEGLPRDALQAALETASRAELMLIVGTSAMVEPAASLPLLAKQNGATLIEVNPEETPLSPHVDEVLRGPAGQMLPQWWQARLGSVN